MNRPIILVINHDTPLHQVVMRTLERSCPQALLLQAHTLREAYPPLHCFSITAVIGGDAFADGTPADLLRLARKHNPLLPVFFLTSSGRNAAVGVEGATAVHVLPAGLGALVSALHRLV